MPLSNIPVQIGGKSPHHPFWRRSKWLCLVFACFITVTGLLHFSLEPKSITFGWLLFFGIAVLGVFSPLMRDVWTLRERTTIWEKADLWIGIFILGVIGFTIILNTTGVLVWHFIYLQFSIGLSLTLLSLVASITERKKRVRVYSSIRGFVFEAETSPGSWITECWLWIPYLLVISVPLFWFQDEALDTGFKKFFVDNCREVLDEENVAAGFAGFDVPTGTNFMEVGIEKFKANRQSQYSSQNTSPSAPEEKSKIEFVGSPDELNCWILNLDSQNSASSNTCASEYRLKQILNANSELISRYWLLSRLPHFQGLGTNGGLLLNINKLIAADVELKLRHGQFENAYQEWKTNYQFIDRMLGEDTTWVDKAIFSVADSFSLASANSLINSYPNIARVHGDELISLLKPTGLARWNLPGVFRAEYLMFDPIISAENARFWLNRNFIRNRYLYAAKDFLEAADAPPNLVEEKALAVWQSYAKLKTWDVDYLRDPINTFFTRIYLLSSLKGASSILPRLHMYDGDRRALTLALLIKRRGIRDTEIETFLAGVGPELINSFTGEPMGWDSTKRVIRFDVPKNGYSFNVKL